MTIASSFSIIGRKLPLFTSAALSNHRRFISAAARRYPGNSEYASRKPQHQLLKARETLRKQYTSVAPVLTEDDKPNLAENEAIGTVAASQANFMRVIVNSMPVEDAMIENSETSGVELLCVVKAVLKKIKRRVMVGDRVLVSSIDWVSRRGMIDNVFQRNSAILDPPVANVDHLLVLFSFEQPKLEPFMLTRFLVEAESTELPLTLALNKTELVEEHILVDWKSRLRSWGYEPVLCSVDTKQGLDTVKFYLRDRMSVIVGPSGVGKSSLINALRGNQHVPGAAEDDNWFQPMLGSKWFEEQRVGEVSTRSGKGKHTTRNVSLLPLSEGGYVADTPGFSQPSLIKVTKRSLAQYFPEIQKMLENSVEGCSFNDCSHVGEPGCPVKGDWERYPYYLQLLDEIRIREEFQLRTIGTKRESDVRIKMGEMGVKQAEPRLERKKHRRVSRKKMNQSMLEELDELDEDDDEIFPDGPIIKG